MDEAANAPAPSINSRREKCEDIVLTSLYCACKIFQKLRTAKGDQASGTKPFCVFYELIRFHSRICLKSKYPKFILPSVNMCMVRTFFPLLRRTLKSWGARFQWCHWRQATGSAGSFVEAIARGPVASFPFTSTDIVPPRFDV